MMNYPVLMELASLRQTEVAERARTSGRRGRTRSAARRRTAGERA